MRRHEFGDLFVLLAVADTRSFTLAAETMNTSQSAVSHAISRLERTMRQPLVLRDARGVQGLTPCGEELVREIGPALRRIQRIVAIFRTQT